MKQNQREPEIWHVRRITQEGSVALESRALDEDSAVLISKKIANGVPHMIGQNYPEPRTKCRQHKEKVS